MPFLVERLGAGPDLVLLHGWGLGPRAWDPVLDALASAFTVHVVALPGYAASAPRPDASVDELAAGLAQIAPAGATLCGWSLGGLIALAGAKRLAASAARLVLVGVNGRFVAGDDWPEALPAARLQEFVAMLDRDPGALLKHFALLIHHGDVHARRTARALAPCLADGLPADAATLRAGLSMLAAMDVRAAAAAAGMPVLLVHGAADPLMPLAGAHRLAGLMPDARLEVFEGAAHAPFAAEPERFAALLRRFVRREFAQGGGR